MEASRRPSRRHRFILTVKVSETDALYQKPDRKGALAAARALYPDATQQRLEEVLWTHTRYPFGDLELWKRQLAEQKISGQSVYNPDGSPLQRPR